MTDTRFQLAQVNIGRARGEMTDPVMEEFAARLPEINALADQSPGFVWRLQTEDGDATAVRPYEDTRILINLSVWADLPALRAYVYRSAHAAVMRRRREWFERFDRVYSVNLYDNVYADFASSAEIAVRRETYGEDLGQSSWLTAHEWLEFADQLGVGGESEILEVGSGSGGPAVYLAARRDCRVTGVDINEHGVCNAIALAQARGLTERVHFEAVDASGPLPFAEARFDAVVSNDAMCHLRNRLAVLRDWHRVLRPGGRALFTDAMVLTGMVSHEELAIRSSIGFYLFVPPGANEELLREAGFVVLGVQDVTANAAEVASRWYEARHRHREALVAREGETNFDGLQRFLRCVHTLSVERRLSRFAYLAEKPAQ